MPPCLQSCRYQWCLQLYQCLQSCLRSCSSRAGTVSGAPVVPSASSHASGRAPVVPVPPVVPPVESASSRWHQVSPVSVPAVSSAPVPPVVSSPVLQSCLQLQCPVVQCLQSCCTFSGGLVAPVSPVVPDRPRVSSRAGWSSGSI